MLLLYPGQLAAVITLVGQCQALFRIQRAYCSIGQGEPFRTRPKHVLSGVAGAALFTAVRYTGEAVHLGQQTSVSAQRCPAPTIRDFILALCIRTETMHFYAFLADFAIFWFGRISLALHTLEFEATTQLLHGVCEKLLRD